MTVQETMTKEQILYKNCVNYTGNEKELTFEEFLKELEHPDTVPFIISMEEYKNQQLSAERERAGKLVEALKKTMRVIEDYEGELSIGYISAKQTLNEYEATRVNELTINDSKDGSPGSDKK